jgi:hypothetical protein
MTTPLVLIVRWAAWKPATMNADSAFIVTTEKFTRKIGQPDSALWVRIG